MELPRCKWHNKIQVCPAQVIQKREASIDTQSSSESFTPENRPIWFLLWEGNQLARVQLVTGELQRMATMHRQNVFAERRKAARGYPVWDASTENRHFTGTGLTLPEMCHAGPMVKSHLWMCSHKSHSSDFCSKLVLCVLLNAVLQQHRAEQGPESQPKELGKYWD